MRVLQVNAFERKVGGAEVYMHTVVDGLRERGHVVSLFAGDPDRDVDEPDRRIVRRPDFELASSLEDPRLAEAFAAHAAAFRPDLVHVHNLANLAASFPRRLAAAGVPVLQTVHDFSLFCTNSWCTLPDGKVCEGGAGAKCFRHGCQENDPYDGRKVLSTLLRYHAARDSFDGFVCPSEFLADLCRSHGLNGVRALPYAAPEGLLGGAQAVRSALAAHPREDRRILFLGRLQREKGVAVLIRAMPTVLAEVPGARLSVVGDGDERASLEALAAGVGVAESVRFHGRLPHAEVLPLLASSTVQVLPSIWCENSPLSCYESFLAGLPIVASRIAGLPELVREGETGLLATPRDPEDLGRTIARVLNDADLRARLARGCREALARYGLAEHLDRLEEIYRQILAAPRRPQAERSGEEDLLATLAQVHREFLELEHWYQDARTHIQILRGGYGGRIRKIMNRVLDRVFTPRAWRNRPPPGPWPGR